MKNSGKVFISGKVTGNPNYVEQFTKAENWLLSRSYDTDDIMNPAIFCSPKWSWGKCMRRCLAVLRSCEAIAQLPNWKKSRGARIEAAFARLTGMTFIPIPESAISKNRKGGCR